MTNPNRVYEHEGLSYEGRNSGPGDVLQREMDAARSSSPKQQYKHHGTRSCTICHQDKKMKGGKNAPDDYGVRRFICKECVTLALNPGSTVGSAGDS